MKLLAKTFFLTLLIAAVVMPAIAQPQRGNQDRQQMEQFRDVPQEVRTEAHIAVFDEYLQLTDIQKEQIRVVDEEFAKKGDALREEPMNRKRKMMQAKDLRDEHQQAIHDILSKDQYAIYLEEKEAIQYEIRQRLKAYSEDGNK